MKFTAVIPNFNGLHLLKKNLFHVIRIFGKAGVVIVDDGSKDGSIDWLKTKYPELTVIEKATNSGFATSVNLGVKAAEGDMVVLLNTDVVPKQDFLEALLPHLDYEPKIREQIFLCLVRVSPTLFPQYSHLDNRLQKLFHL